MKSRNDWWLFNVQWADFSYIQYKNKFNNKYKLFRNEGGGGGGVNDIWLTPKRYEELGGDEKFSLL
jgi:hypothetical protein